MHSTIKAYSLLVMGFMCATILLTAAFWPVSATIQQAQERIVKKYSWRNEPLEISKLKIKGKLVEQNKKFSEADDWLRGFTVSVKNISPKTIIYIEMNLEF